MYLLTQVSSLAEAAREAVTAVQRNARAPSSAVRQNRRRAWAWEREKRSTGHTHTHTDREQQPRHTRTRQEQQPKPPNEHLPQTLNARRGEGERLDLDSTPGEL